MSTSRTKFEAHCESIRRALWPSTGAVISNDSKTYSGVSLMVGSGMSQNAEVDPAFGDKPPTWADISRNLVEPLAPKNKALQEKLIQTTGAVSGFLRLAQMYEAEFNRNDLEDFIKRQVQDHALKPGELHKILVRLPWTDIFTTNWDTLLETAGRQDRVRNYYPILKADDFPGSRRPRIIKLHGTIGVSNRCIFTEEDFRKYPSEHATFVNSVRQSIMETIMVLIGFSGEDPNFLNWTGWVRDQLADFSPRIYLVDHFEGGMFINKLLEDRNVIPLDLGQIMPEELSEHGIDDHGISGRLEFWLRYLLHGEQPPLTIWPLENSRLQRSTQAGRDRDNRRPVNLNAGLHREVSRRVLFSANTPNKTVSGDIVDRMIEEIDVLRNSYREWVIMPADARDEIRDLLRIWIRAFQPNTKFGLGNPVLKSECQTGAFLSLCFLILSQPEPRKVAMTKFSTQKRKNGSDDAPTEEEVDVLRRWVDGSLFSKLRELLCDYLWICNASQADWPEGVFRNLAQIMQWSPKTDPEDEDAQPRLDPAKEYPLAVSYLYRALEHGATREEWTNIRNIVRRVAERAGQKADAVHQIAIASMMYARDRGARQRVLRRVRCYASDRLPTEPVLINRLAGIIDEVAENGRDLALAQSLRLEVFRRTQEKIGSIITRFDAVSLEAWNLALQRKGQHMFLTETMSNETGVTLNVRLSVDTRLDQLKSLRCDPLREMRRADRNVGNLDIRRQSVRIFDAVGLPLVIQTRDRYNKSLVHDFMLDNFIENSLKEEFAAFQQRTKHLSLSKDGVIPKANPDKQMKAFQRLDGHLVHALRLLFRICANPSFALNSKDHSAYLRDLADGAQFCFDVAPDGAVLDPACIHFCLDAIDWNITAAGPKKSPANVVQIATLVLGHLLLSRRVGNGRTMIIDPDLALKAVRVLSKIRLEDKNFKKIETSLLPPSVSTDRRLVEALLRFAIAQSLKHHQQIRDVFRELAKNITGNGDPADHTFVEPFRLLDVPPENREAWQCPEIIDDALLKLTDGGVTNPKNRANLIRIVDALDDWNCDFSAEQRKTYRKLIKQEFKKKSAAELERWEWMMIEEVRAEATNGFLAWAFGEDHPIDASTADGRFEAKKITRNLYWAICQRRTKLDLAPEHVVALLKWINRTITEYRANDQIDELHSSSHFRDLFFTVFGELNKLEALDNDGAGLAMTTLVELHGLGVSVEPVIPYFAERFSQRPASQKRLQRLGAILREGLATIHYDERSAQFNATIDATLEWVKASSSTPQKADGSGRSESAESGGNKGKAEKRQMLPPPPSLLGALGQALAVPATSRGGRVLEAIRLILIRSKQEDDRNQLASDVLFDIQRRVDTLLEATRQRRESGKGHKTVVTAKIFDELTQIHATFLGLPEAKNYEAELKRLGKSIASLRPKV